MLVVLAVLGVVIDAADDDVVVAVFAIIMLLLNYIFCFVAASAGFVVSAPFLFLKLALFCLIGACFRLDTNYSTSSRLGCFPAQKQSPPASFSWDPY